MNGVAFANVPRLSVVQLQGNVCIGMNLEPPRALKSFRNKISKSCVSPEATKKEISCDSEIFWAEIIYIQNFQLSSENSENCVLEFGSYVDSEDYSFVADSNYDRIDTIVVMNQPNVEFLPVLVNDRFPMVKKYAVVNTLIGKISSKNFEKLFKLEQLLFENNRIETIRSDTFRDLMNLKELYIRTLNHYCLCSDSLMWLLN